MQDSNLLRDNKEAYLCLDPRLEHFTGQLRGIIIIIWIQESKLLRDNWEESVDIRIKESNLLRNNWEAALYLDPRVERFTWQLRDIIIFSSMTQMIFLPDERHYYICIFDYNAFFVNGHIPVSLCIKVDSKTFYTTIY